MRRSPLRLGLSLAFVVALGAMGLLAGTSASASPAFIAWGTVRCTMSGTNVMKPGLTFSATPGTRESFKAKLACSTGTTGHSSVTVNTGRITATSVPATLSCSSASSPPVSATIKWKATGGKVSPTTITWGGATDSASPRMSRSYPATASTVTGSYAGGGAQAFLVSDTPDQAGCFLKNGMKKFKFTGLGGASTFEIVNSPANAVEIFRDDFNGTSLDLSKWRPNWLGKTNTAVSKPVNTKEQGCYDPRQVSVSGGSLHLSAVARSCTATNGVTYPYASGIVQTRDHFTFTYGSLEARLWTPPGSGAIQNWPAFWADGTGTHPLTGELDVFEGLAGKACWHFHSNSGEPGGCASASNPSGWHTYAAEWRPGVVTYFYDGVQVGRITTGITSSPMFVILNLGVSSTVSGPVTVPSEMLVDYVRVTS
jgi:Glycosyl hydrolases family 16